MSRCESIYGSKGLRSSDLKERRDLLIYLLWKTGRFSNQAFGNMLGVTYSAVRKIVGSLNEHIRSDKDVRDMLNQINSLFKVRPRCSTRCSLGQYHGNDMISLRMRISFLFWLSLVSGTLCLLRVKQGVSCSLAPHRCLHLDYLSF